MPVIHLRCSVRDNLGFSVFPRDTQVGNRTADPSIWGRPGLVKEMSTTSTTGIVWWHLEYFLRYCWYSISAGKDPGPTWPRTGTLDPVLIRLYILSSNSNACVTQLSFYEGIEDNKCSHENSSLCLELLRLIRISWQDKKQAECALLKRWHTCVYTWLQMRWALVDRRSISCMCVVQSIRSCQEVFAGS